MPNCNTELNSEEVFSWAFLDRGPRRNPNGRRLKNGHCAGYYLGQPGDRFARLLWRLVHEPVGRGLCKVD